MRERSLAISIARCLLTYVFLPFVAPVLGVAVPELYRWGGRGLQNANTEPRALLVGLDMVSVPNDRRATFRVARAMCLMRNEFYLASAVTHPTLVALVQAAIAKRGGAPSLAQKSSDPCADCFAHSIRHKPSGAISA